MWGWCWFYGTVSVDVMVNVTNTSGAIILFLILLSLASLSFYYDQHNHSLFSTDSSTRTPSAVQRNQSFTIPSHHNHQNKPTKQPSIRVDASHQPTTAPQPSVGWKVKHPKPTRIPLPTKTPAAAPPEPFAPSFGWKRSPVKHPKPTQTPHPTKVPVATRSPSRMNLPTTDLQCTITPTESCSLSSLEMNENIQIFPAIDSGCGCIESYEKYSFVVTKGDPNNLLIYFQGGGLCWDQDSFRRQKCRTYTNAPSEIGILDRTQPIHLNPFANFTTVTIPYCSGDFFLGNSSDSYVDSLGKPIHYHGRQNAWYILQWLQKELNTGEYLAKGSAAAAPPETGTAAETERGNQSKSQLEKLVLSGSSAGSIGVLAWSSQYSQAIPAKTTLVLADSLLIYSPPSYASYFYDKWNFCSSLLLPPSLLTSCQSKQLQQINLLETIITSNPHINFFFISSKRDWTAVTLYNAILRSFKSHTSPSRSSSPHPHTSPPSPSPTLALGLAPPTPSTPLHSQRSSAHRHDPLSEDEYFKEIQSLLLNLFHRQHPINLNFYLIDSFSHIYLTRDTYFTTTPVSEHGLTLNLTSTGLPLTEWLVVISSVHLNNTPLLSDAVTRHSVGKTIGSSSICEGDGCAILFQAMQMNQF